MTQEYLYSPGNKLSLYIEDFRIDATVIHAFQPFTLSCVVLVRLICPQLELNGNYVLKLYDRRFATQLRTVGPDYSWNTKVEKEFRNFVLGGLASEFFSYCATNDAADREADESSSITSSWIYDAQECWNQAQNEAYLQYHCRKLYKTELNVYRKLESLQGSCIPRLEGQVKLRLSKHSSLDKYLSCPGILLEYIEGVSWEDLALVSPLEMQYIGEEAIRIVNYIGSQDIRNTDVKLRSFIMREDPTTRLFRPCMIDFGNCVLRWPGQSNDSWEYWKAVQDEEGAIGRVLQSKFGPHIFKYTQTPEFAELHGRHMSG